MKTSTRANGHAKSHTYPLQKDYKKIKTALKGAQRDVRKHAKLWWEDSLDNLKDSTTDLQDVAANYINERPFKTLSMVAAIAFIFGFLFRK